MTPDPAPRESAPPTSLTGVALTSAAILGTAREVTILHHGEAYRLRITSNDRLILTK